MFFTAWGTYSVAGGTGLSFNAAGPPEAAETTRDPVYSVKDELLAPVKPGGTLDMDARMAQVRRVG